MRSLHALATLIARYAGALPLDIKCRNQRGEG